VHVVGESKGAQYKECGECVRVRARAGGGSSSSFSCSSSPSSLTKPSSFHVLFSSSLLLSPPLPFPSPTTHYSRHIVVVKEQGLGPEVSARKKPRRRLILKKCFFKKKGKGGKV
jgi:hypothetical protein